MAAEDYLPECWEIELYDAYSQDFYSNPEPKMRRLEEEMDKSLENVKCPDCGGDMVSRKSNFGVFWGCRNYPVCKGTRDNQGRSKADREEYKRKLAEEKNEEYDSSETESKKGEGFSFKKN